LELQALDTSIGRLEHRRTQLEAGEETSVARKEMQESESRLGELRLALDAVGTESRRLELEIDSMTAKLAAEEKRMYDGTIANAKELEALQHEIAGLKDRRSRAEDQLIEQMERREELDGRATKADEEVVAARAHVDALGGDAAKELEQVEAGLAQARLARGALAP